MLQTDIVAVTEPGNAPHPVSQQTSPQAVPGRGIWHVAGRIYAEFSEDRIPTVAGGITFFVLLALFPAIASVVSLYGLFAHRGDIGRDLDLVSGFLPGGAVTVIKAELHRLALQKRGTLNLAFLTSSVIALWSASGGFKATVEGLNIAFEVTETRSFLRLSLHALGFTIAAMVFAVVAINLGLVVPMLTARLPDARLLHGIAAILVWLLLFAACDLIIALLYRFAPDRRAPRWRWISWGSAIASVFWLSGTQIFTWYAQNFGSYNRVYGDLGAAVGFLTWVWLSLVILLLGAEIDCELSRRAKTPP